MESQSNLSVDTWVIIGPWGRRYVSEERAKLAVQGRKSGEPLTVDDEWYETVWAVVRAATLEDEDRRRNGQWNCRSGYWHNKSDKCTHDSNRTWCKACDLWVLIPHKCPKEVQWNNG